MAEDIWTIRRMLAWCQDYLERHGDSNPLLSAQWLICGATGLERIELYANFDKPLSASEKDYLRDAVRRRGAGEPLQYIVGETSFRFIPVRVRPGVLIPRPETELLAGEVIDWLKDHTDAPEKAHSMVPLGGAVEPAVEPAAEPAAESLGHSAVGTVADSAAEPAAEPAVGSAAEPAAEFADDPNVPVVVEIGSGSGCISCSVAYEVANVWVLATDISLEACQITEENVVALGLQDKVQVIECDMGCKVPPELMGKVEVVVSNPPYVPTEVCAGLQPEVKDFEPMLALDGGADGLDVARRLFQFSRAALRPGGLMVVELFEGHMREAAALAKAAGFQQVEVKQDLTGRPRILWALAPEGAVEASSEDAMEAALEDAE
ncbi:MAG: peptide chain release factor N(5)-glutamine methyltransferase [Eggerthellales bacterium]|nr:peptide chain release factor N(5)-glutamine methyltransferase [Eggerthellales bacterium]